MTDERSKNTSETSPWEPSDLDLAKYMVHDALQDFKVFLQWVRTKDEAEGWSKRPWPTDLAYINWLADKLQTREESPAPVWLPKSRRLLITWTFCAYILWRAMRNGATHAFIQSNKLDDADFLLKERVAYIYTHLPYWFKYVAFGGKTEPYQKEARLHLPNGAMIWGFPQGPDVARQFTPSIIFVDEAAKQDRFKEAVTAIMPLAEKKTELYFVSTARPSFMGDVVTSLPEGDIEQPIKGVRTWSLKHGGLVWEIHHTADPKKDPDRKGTAFMKEQDKKYIGGVGGTDWLQEMDIDWGAKEGEVVYDAYSDTIGEPTSSVVEPFDISLFEDRYAVIDWGIRNPTCILWIGRLGDSWYIYREWCDIPKSVEGFKSMFWNMSVYYDDDKRVQQERFKRIIIDPASQRSDNPSAKSVFYLLRTGKNSMPVGKANRTDDGIQLVREWLAQGRLKVFSNCTRTRWEFKQLKWAKLSVALERTHNPKESPMDVDNHAMDCIKYFANMMRISENKRYKVTADRTQTEIDRILAESDLKKQYYQHA